MTKVAYTNARHESFLVRCRTFNANINFTVESRVGLFRKNRRREHNKRGRASTIVSSYSIQYLEYGAYQPVTKYITPSPRAPHPPTAYEGRRAQPDRQ